MFFKVRELMEMGWELERFFDLVYVSNKEEGKQFKFFAEEDLDDEQILDITVYLEEGSNLVLNGFKISCQKDAERRSGFKVLAEKDGNIIDCYIAPKGDKGYWRVYLGNSVEAKARSVPFQYLHKIVYACAMGWKGVDIMSNGNVHHIKYGEDIRNVPSSYNDITNLIYLPRNEHSLLHALIRKRDRLIKSPKRDLFSGEIAETQDRIDKIIKKYCAIRNNKIKANNKENN